MISVMILITFFTSIRVINAKSECGDLYKKIKKPSPGTCSVNVVDENSTTVPTLVYRCNTEKAKDNNGKKIVGVNLQNISIYKGTKDKHTGPVYQWLANVSSCSQAGDFAPNPPLEENTQYYLEYKSTRTIEQGAFWQDVNNRYREETIINSMSFKTKASKSTKAPTNNTCTISIPSEQINTISFVAKYKCSGNAKATKYVVKQGNSKLSTTNIKKKYNGEGSLAISSLKANTAYEVVLYYEVGKDTKKIRASANTKREDETTTKTYKAGEDDSVNNPASQAKLSTNQKEYDPSNGATTCSNLSVKDLIDEYWRIVVMILPAALILLTSVDFLKAIVSGNDDQIKKSSNAALKRTLAAVVLLMLPYFLSLLLGWFGIELCI